MADDSWDIPDLGEELDSSIWVREFVAEREAEADNLGMTLFDYLSESHGGILKDTMRKMKLHAEAHPGKCPPDCSWQASMKRLRKKYGDKRQSDEAEK